MEERRVVFTSKFRTAYTVREKHHVDSNGDIYISYFWEGAEYAYVPKNITAEIGGWDEHTAQLITS